MIDDIAQLGDLAGTFADDEGGPRPRCRLCRDSIGWSAERAEGDICRDCAETIADPETLRTLAQWLDKPNQLNDVICQRGDRRYTLGMIFREVADAIDSHASAEVADPGHSPAADRSTTAVGAGSASVSRTRGT